MMNKKSFPQAYQTFFAIFCFLLIIGIGRVHGQISVPIDSIISRLEVIADSDSATPKILNNLGFAYVNVGRIDKAIESYKKAIAMDTTYSEAYNNLGYAYSLKGQIQQAVRSFQQAIRFDPAYADAYNNIGLILMNQNQTQEAILQFRQAIQVKPEYHVAFGNLGFSFLKIGMLDSAVAAAQKATQIQPDFAPGYNILGMVYFQRKKFEEALREYKRALRINQGFTNARYNLAITLSVLGRNNEAVTELETLIKQVPNNISFAYQLALQYFNTTNVENAFKLGEQIIKADTTFLEAFLLMGRVENVRGNLTESRKYFLRASALDPKLADPWYNLGVMDLNSNLLVSAEEELLKAQSLAPERREVNFSLGILYLTFNEPEKALRSFEAELKLNPEFQPAKDALAKAQETLKRFQSEAQSGKLRARIIIIKTKAEAETILKRLKSGESFANLAFSVSSHSSAGNGGDSGFLDLKDIQPEMAAILNKTKVGSLSDIIKTKDGFQILLRLN